MYEGTFKYISDVEEFFIWNSKTSFCYLLDISDVEELSYYNAFELSPSNFTLSTKKPKIKLGYSTWL